VNVRNHINVRVLYIASIFNIRNINYN